METKKLTKEEFLEKLKTDRDFNNRYGRKHITEGKMVLPPCHYGFQVYTRELSIRDRLNYFEEFFDCTPNSENMNEQEIHIELSKSNIPTRAISLMWNQRSVDTFLGLPFNIASYGLLLEIIAKEVNMVPDELIGNLGDVHLYANHVEQAKKQIEREPYELPTLKIHSSKIDDIAHHEITDFKIENYQSHPAIKAPLSN
jgi:thymidylate synthase